MSVKMTAKEYRAMINADRFEVDFKADVFRYLETIGVWVWNNPRGVYTVGGQSIVFGGPEGASDLFGVLPNGRFLAVETKNPNGTGRVSVGQQHFVNRVNRMGGVGVIAKTIEEVIAQVRPETVRRKL